LTGEVAFEGPQYVGKEPRAKEGFGSLEQFPAKAEDASYSVKV
jgi:hypothetical protein